MSKPAVELAEVVRRFGSAFLEAYGASLSRVQKTVLRALLLCRTSALGGHLEQCDNSDCSYQRPAYNSCRNRHCPKCQSLAKARWIAARQQQLLPVVYFHVVFTLPEAIARLALQNKAVIYNLLFQTTAATLRSIAADPKHLGTQIGFFAILHTWGQQLTHHPHLHCVVPGGGLSPDGQHWISCRCSNKNGKHFFLPVQVLSARFRHLFRDALLEAFQQGQSSRSLAIWPSSPTPKPSAAGCRQPRTEGGSSMPSGPLAAPPRSSTISAATPTASPSPTTAC